MKMGIVIGSVREGRVSDRIAKWVARSAENAADIEIEIFDLKEHPMVLFDEPRTPIGNPDRNPTGEVKSWVDFVSRSDALVLVTPEYNRSYSSAIKNALDYTGLELSHKPVGLVAHGSTGGAQAVAHLRGVIPGLKAVTIPRAVMLVGYINSMFNEDGQLNAEIAEDPRGPQASLDNAIKELKWYSDALAKARAEAQPI